MIRKTTVLCFALILSFVFCSVSEAKSLIKGEVYRSLDGRGTIGVISSSELEITEGGETTLAKYGFKDDKLRAVFGNTVIYFKITKDGLNQAKAGQETNNCFAYKEAGDYQRAIEAGERAVELYPKDGNANFCLGNAYRSIGQLKLALTYMKEAERLFTSKQELMFVYNQLGMIFDNIGDYDNTLFYYNKYLSLARELGNRREEACALSNIAGIFRIKGITDKALTYYKESLKLIDEKDKAATYNNIGNLYSQKGEYQKAIEYIKKALELHERNGDYHNTATSTLNLGDTYRKVKDFVHTEEYLTEGLKMILKVGDKFWEAGAYQYLGWLYRDKGETQKAKDYLTKAYNLFDSIGAKAGAQYALKSLKELDNSKGPAK